MALVFPDKVLIGNSKASGIVNETEVSGSRVVATLSDLYSIPDAILSPSGSNADNDAIGQQWFVVEKNTHYFLKTWANRKSSSGWQVLDANVTWSAAVASTNSTSPRWQNGVIPLSGYRQIYTTSSSGQRNFCGFHISDWETSLTHGSSVSDLTNVSLLLNNYDSNGIIQGALYYTEYTGGPNDTDVIVINQFKVDYDGCHIISQTDADMSATGNIKIYNSSKENGLLIENELAQPLVDGRGLGRVTSKLELDTAMGHYEDTTAYFYPVNNLNTTSLASVYGFRFNPSGVPGINEGTTILNSIEITPSASSSTEFYVNVWDSTTESSPKLIGGSYESVVFGTVKAKTIEVSPVLLEQNKYYTITFNSKKNPESYTDGNLSLSLSYWSLTDYIDAENQVSELATSLSESAVDSTLGGPIVTFHGYCDHSGEITSSYLGTTATNPANIYGFYFTPSKIGTKFVDSSLKSIIVKSASLNGNSTYKTLYLNVWRVLGSSYDWVGGSKKALKFTSGSQELEYELIDEISLSDGEYLVSTNTILNPSSPTDSMDYIRLNHYTNSDGTTTFSWFNGSSKTSAYIPNFKLVCDQTTSDKFYSYGTRIVSYADISDVAYCGQANTFTEANVFTKSVTVGNSTSGFLNLGSNENFSYPFQLMYTAFSTSFYMGNIISPSMTSNMLLMASDTAMMHVQTQDADNSNALLEAFNVDLSKTAGSTTVALKTPERIHTIKLSDSENTSYREVSNNGDTIEGGYLKETVTTSGAKLEMATCENSASTKSLTIDVPNSITLKGSIPFYTDKTTFADNEFVTKAAVGGVSDAIYAKIDEVLAVKASYTTFGHVELSSTNTSISSSIPIGLLSDGRIAADMSEIPWATTTSKGMLVLATSLADTRDYAYPNASMVQAEFDSLVIPVVESAAVTSSLSYTTASDQATFCSFGFTPSKMEEGNEVTGEHELNSVTIGFRNAVTSARYFHLFKNNNGTYEYIMTSPTSFTSITAGSSLEIVFNTVIDFEENYLISLTMTSSAPSNVKQSGGNCSVYAMGVTSNEDFYVFNSGSTYKTIRASMILKYTDYPETIKVDGNELPLVTYVDSGLATKQNTLTAGNNITISNDVISASMDWSYLLQTDLTGNSRPVLKTNVVFYQTEEPEGSAGFTVVEYDFNWIKTQLESLSSNKQDNLTAGANVTIENGVISATISGSTVDTSELEELIETQASLITRLMKRLNRLETSVNAELISVNTFYNGNEIEGAENSTTISGSSSPIEIEIADIDGNEEDHLLTLTCSGAKIWSGDTDYSDWVNTNILSVLSESSRVDIEDLKAITEGVAFGAANNTTTITFDGLDAGETYEIALITKQTSQGSWTLISGEMVTGQIGNLQSTNCDEFTTTTRTLGTNPTGICLQLKSDSTGIISFSLSLKSLLSFISIKRITK